MKAALCFIINYDHVLNKEHIWREWIEPNKDILNVYFYYKSRDKIKSPWILEHAIPSSYIFDTSYYYVIPAYVSILKYAIQHDEQNRWFCVLTDSCCPIISPSRFRELFYSHCDQSIFSWKFAWWNPSFHKRGNLALLPKNLWLANEPWFVLTKENVKQLFHFIHHKKELTHLICQGGLANESLFAIVFKLYHEIDTELPQPQPHDKNKNTKNNNKNNKNKNTKNKGNTRIICALSHLADWNRPSSTTSPHVFKEGSEQDMLFIRNELERNKFALFIRKVDVQFPDEILRSFIQEPNCGFMWNWDYAFITNLLFFIIGVYVLNGLVSMNIPITYIK